MTPIIGNVLYIEICLLTRGLHQLPKRLLLLLVAQSIINPFQNVLFVLAKVCLVPLEQHGQVHSLVLNVNLHSLITLEEGLCGRTEFVVQLDF